MQVVGRERACAKVNLFLHVVRRRQDGYHELDSLVAFAGVGDELDVAPARGLSLTLDGVTASGLGAGQDNLVMRAAEQLRDAFDVAEGAHLSLHKTLPVAAGLGGGSADAAAALRLLCRHWGLTVPAERLQALAGKLGADVPVCLLGRAARMAGIGHDLTPLTAFAEVPVVLVNPGIPVSTPEVFARLTEHSGVATWPMSDRGDCDLGQPETLLAFVTGCRNDLEGPARELVPAIADVLDALRQSGGNRLARMSGSGASCFGLYDDDEAAQDAARSIARAHPAWWVAASTLRGQAPCAES